ncbi:MAG: hypothetical protein H7Z41_14225 [Cytophagales bacterium]|nr:hypothetical protein [Armatimonadota bacterium]
MRHSGSGVPTAARLSMERIRLTFFVVRHLLGAAVFIWLTITCFRMDAANLGYLLAVLTPLYLGFAVYGGRTLLRRYRRLADQQRAAGAGRGAGIAR